MERIGLMGVYRVNEDELNRAIGTLNHIHNKLERCYDDLNRTYRSLQNQSGLGIQNVKYTINAQKETLRIQKHNVQQIRDCVQSIINKTKEASVNAQKILESVDLSKAMVDAAAVASGVAGAVTGAGGEKNNAAPANPTGAGGVSNNVANYPRTFYYNLGSWIENNNIVHPEWACVTCSYTMALNALGVNVNPYDIYKVNGNSVSLNRAAVLATYGINRSEIAVAGNADGNYQRVYETLQNNPQGVILRNGANTHSVYAYIGEDGQIKVNDPGLPRGEGIALEKAWEFSGWGDISQILLLSR